MMPTAAPDRWSKDRPANYFDDMLQNKPESLFRKYAVHAADNPEGYTVDTTEIRDPSHTGSFEGGSVPSSKVISWLHLVKLPRNGPNYIPGAADLKEGGDTIDCKASITAKPNWVPAYFLPWKPQAMVSMTIPAKGTRLGDDPDIFFTAAINGCSVFFQGTAQNPTIYHCGGDPDYRPNPKMKKVDGFKRPVRSPSEAASFWRSLVLAHGDLTQGIGGEVNKMHYLMSKPTADPSKKTTSRSEEYFRWLKKNNLGNKDRFRFSEVRPWGCVYGLRTGNDWQFYLQENATIRYTTVNTTTTQRTYSLEGPLGLHAEFSGKEEKTRVDVSYYDVARPMCVRQIWPNGGGKVEMRHPAGLELA